jgi:hypothetical protein
VADRGSTNGTYVNGMQVRRPYELRLGDRVTIGETTMVLREFSPHPPTPRTVAPAPGAQARPGLELDRTEEMEAVPEQTGSAQPGAAAGRAAPRQPIPRTAAPERAVAWASVAFWLMQGLIALAITCLIAGAFLPWLRVAVPNTADEVRIPGIDGYGFVVLAVAAVCLIAGIVDRFVSRRSVAQGIVSLLSSLVALGFVAPGLIRVYTAGEAVQSSAVFLGIRLAEAIQPPGSVVDVQINPSLGLYLVAIGSVLLLAGGVGRLLLALLHQEASGPR